jgi:hypothetical protein
MYGNRSVKSIKEKKQEEQEITLLQSKAAVNSPNFAILNKLKQEMENLSLMRVSYHFFYTNKFASTQLYGIVVRAPDFGPRGPRFETRARRIFHDLGKVSKY